MKTRVFIRPPVAGDAAAFLRAVRQSRALHRPWVCPPATPGAYQEYLRRISSDTHCGFLVLHRQGGRLVGVVNVSNIVRRTFQSASLGYYAFDGFAGQGLMREALQRVLARAFGQLKLHRLEANIQPDNAPSLALVRRCGFVHEGFSRRFLKLAGRWRDHERWAILAEDWRAARRNVAPGAGASPSRAT